MGPSTPKILNLLALYRKSADPEGYSKKNSCTTINTKMTNSPVRKWAKDFNMIFSKEIYRQQIST